ncbi:TIGR02302 family protein [Lichenihabitans psoromatis]|uniref:TIGR02302 family protein n=1 Tax=Lichenihabitans psoromatis TaxID=2528642 RepID=UPI0013F17456|nr:TIGR02302 family protein [Lichenihabitans psoromatis]
MPDQKDATPGRIDRLIGRALWTLRFERLWPAIVLAAGLVALFVTLSWLGVWVVAPRIVRIAGVLAILGGLGWAAVLAYRAAWPTRSEALNRLDRDSGSKHRPVSAAADHLANHGSDPTTRALWEVYRKRLEGTVARIRVARPSPRMVDRDPFALRALALLALVAAAFVAGADRDSLLGTAFDWRGTAGAAGPGFRVDAWIDPPLYTGRPPVVLVGPDHPVTQNQTVTAPAHSTVVIRWSGTGRVDVASDPGLKADAPVQTAQGSASPAASDRLGASATAIGAEKGSAKPEGPEKRFTLTRNATLTLTHDGTSLGSVALQAIPDMPPTISLIGKPEPASRGGLTLNYKIDDDYGVTGAEASFADPAVNGTPIAGRSLVPPPRLTLSLPATAGGLGTGQTKGDLSDHPWAGAEVSMVLSVKDEGGNVGMSAPVRMVLPVRVFTKPLARALVEQRQALVFNPDHRDGVATALDALMIAPDDFGTTKAIYLGLYTARQRLDSARTDQDLIDLSDYFWQMALRIEDGDLTQAQQDLRAAEQALREAMDKGASPDEIKKLTDNLRQQMDKLLAEMMQQEKGEQQQGEANPNVKMVTPKDLAQMMKRMEDAARSGDMAEAQRLLDQLQGILDNLKTAKKGSAGDQAAREMNRQMSELDRMTRDQQAVRDKTFQQGKTRRSPPSGSPQSGDQQMGQGADPDDDSGDMEDQSADNEKPSDQPGDQQAQEDLKQQQQALRQRLDDLQKKMRDLGMKGEQGLDDAESAMKDAEGALSKGNGSSNRQAVEAQGRALEGLQKGANGLAQQMAQGQSDQDGEGQGGTTGQGMANGSDTDPLGRQRGGRGVAETRGTEIGEGVAARAQRVLQELRKRLGDPSRPQEEQDYLERLLKRY